jgi:hypothetical protein
MGTAWSRSLVLIVGLALAATLAPWTPGTPRAQGSDTCPVVEEGEVGRWTRRTAPATPSGRDRITAHAVDPADPTRHLITDGVSVLRTTDDGCTWEPTFTLPDEPGTDLAASAATDRILDLVAHPTVTERVWAVVAVGQTVADDLDAGLLFTPAAREQRDITATVVLRSDDGGATWARVGPPAPLPGAPMRLAPTAADPDVAYLALNGTIHATRDGGETWEPRPTVMTSPGTATERDLTPVPFDLAVHPEDPDTVLSRSRDHAFRSGDGGLTWTELPPGITNFPSGPYVERFGADADGLRALYVHQQLADAHPRALHRYREEHDDLQELPVVDDEILGAPLDAVWHPDRDEVLLATWQNNIPSDRFDRVSLYLLDLSVPRDGEHAARVTEIDELGLAPLSGVDVDVTGSYHVHDDGELVSLHLSGRPSAHGGEGDGAGRCRTVGDVPELTPADPPAPEPAELAVPGTVGVDAGETRATRARLELPAAPGLLDLYLLLDTSNGFRDDLGDVARGMADVSDALVEAGVDAQVGLGGLGTADTYRYRRVVDVGPVGEELRRGLAGLCASGSYESHLISLDQTATGSGLPDGGQRRPEVPAGQDPTWREDSLRTVVLVTDNEFDDRTAKEDDPDAPPRQEVLDAFVERDLRLVGVEVVRDVVTPLPQEGQEGAPGWLAAAEAADAAGETAPSPARQDMEWLASATGTVAPPGGVDCRGTGRTELHEGDPLVCTTFSASASGPVAGESTMGDVLRRVLLAQTDPRPVELAVVDDGGAEVEITDGPDEVDVRRDHVDDAALDFELAVGCDPERAGERLDVELAAEVDGRTVAQATTTLECTAGAGTTPAPGDGGPGPASTARPAHSPPDPAPAPPPPSGAPAAPAPIAGPGSATTPAPTPAPGHGSATGQAAGQAPAPGHAPTPGEAGAPGQATGVANSTAPAAGPGTSTAAGNPPAPAVAGPQAGGRARLGVAGAAARTDLTFSARPSTTRLGLPPTGLLIVAASGFGLALALGTRRARPPQRARRRAAATGPPPTR